jgi:hypothetical protein
MATKFEDSNGIECKLFRVSRTIAYFVLSEDAPEAEDLFPVGDVMECNPESTTETSIHEVKSLARVAEEERKLSVYEASGEFTGPMEEFMEAMNTLATLDGEEG